MLNFSSQALLQRGLYVIVLLLSLAVHEFAHAWSAWRLGDDTAARMGRLTLNPLAHADPVGTFLLPLLGIPFGWARPVPVNPARFRRDVRMGTGMALTAAAGPISNLVLATAATAAYALLVRFAPGSVEPGSGAERLLQIGVYLNVNLAIFNLIPIPPLDGSRIVDGFLPVRLRPAWEQITALSPFLLIAVFFFAGRLIAGPSAFVLELLDQLARAIVA
ncbi:MAG TPA: site-2 protease family protein [Anaeromyxobacteraceae bacterium]|nr:site-2 protease family protein [Anaeromyxobacteraceae bacterium]